MRRVVTMPGLLVVAGLVGAGGMPAHAAARERTHAGKSTKCRVGNYKHARWVVAPDKGPFKCEIGGAPTFLKGKGNSDQSGTQVITQKVSMPGLKKGDLAFKVYSNGSFPKLSLAGPQK